MLFCIRSLGGKFQFFNHLIDLCISRPCAWFKWINQNRTRVFLCYLFNFHSSVNAGNHSWSLAVSIEDECKINLTLYVNTFVDQNCINLKSLFNCLVRYKIVSKHLFSEFFYFIRSIKNLNSSLKSRSKMSFSSSSSMDLRLENQTFSST